MKHDPNLSTPNITPPPVRSYQGPQQPFALRAYLLSDIVHARSLEDLQGRLFAKGYTLGVSDEHICVLQNLMGHTLCSASDIGIERLGDAGVFKP